MSKAEQRWEVILSRTAEKVLGRLPRNLAERIDEAIQALATNPRPPGCKKLSGMGYTNHYRIRVGEWRISYAIEEDELIILVIEIAPRGNAYRFD
jgi:mRNA interferase RelE/StbE